MNSEVNSRPGAGHKLFKKWQLIALFREEGEEPLVCLKEEEALTKLANFLAKFNDLVSDIGITIIIITIVIWQVVLTITPEDVHIVLEKLKTIPEAPKLQLVGLRHQIVLKNQFS